MADIVLSSNKKVVRALESQALFSAQVDSFMDLVWEERERRLKEWVKKGRTQSWIAKETGRAQQTVSRWMTEFEIEPSHPEMKRAHIAPATGTNDTLENEEFDEEELDRRIRKAGDEVKAQRPQGGWRPEAERVPPSPRNSRSQTPIVIHIGTLHQVANETWPLLKGNYLEEAEEEDLELVEACIDQLLKIVGNLKAKLKEHDNA
jgi:hypothetical protein